MVYQLESTLTAKRVRREESGVERMVWGWRTPALLIRIEGLPSFSFTRWAVGETVEGSVMSQVKW